MEKPHTDIDKLQQKIDRERTAAKVAANKSVNNKLAPARSTSSGLVLTLAGGLVVLGLAFTYAQMLGRQAVTRVTAGSIGAAAGLLVGYSIGRKDKAEEDSSRFPLVTATNNTTAAKDLTLSPPYRNKLSISARSL